MDVMGFIDNDRIDMRGPHMRIIVRGWYGFYNFGDDCLMIACHELLKRSFSQSDYAFICGESEYPQKLIPGIRMIPRNIQQDVECDLLLYGGGTQFCSFKKTPAWYIKNVLLAIFGSILFVASVCKPSHKVHGRIAAAIGVGFGPFVPRSKALKQAEKLAKSLDFLSVRDVKSRALCREWGLHRVNLHADLCFWPPLREVFAVKPRRVSKNSVRTVGIIVRDWQNDIIGDAYAKQIFTVAERLQKRGMEVRFILFAGTKDRIWSFRVGTKFPVLAWNPLKSTAVDYLENLRQCDAFITARYHGAIFAALLGVPFISIESEPKLSMIAGLLGVGEYLWKYPFDGDDCMKLLDNVSAHYATICHAMEQAVRAQSELADKMVAEFEAFLRSQELCH
jgi:polysaccharide pyruvyl transferase WcaK-like protein